MAYLTVVHNLMSVWIVQVGGGAPSWPSALLGAADRVGGDHPDRVRAGDSTRHRQHAKLLPISFAALRSLHPNIHDASLQVIVHLLTALCTT